MKLNQFGQLILFCSNNDRFAILKALQRKKMNYKEIQAFLGIGDSGKFAYHLRKLKNLSIVEKSDHTLSYGLTKRGERMIEIMENTLGEKYIGGDISEVCNNTDEGNHKFITICRKCSYIKKDKLVLNHSEIA